MIAQVLLGLKGNAILYSCLKIPQDVGLGLFFTLPTETIHQMPSFSTSDGQNSTSLIDDVVAHKNLGLEA